MDKSNKQLKWHNKSWFFFILCIVLFPIGIYILWKDSSITKSWKTVYIGAILMAVLFFGYLLLYFIKNNDFNSSNDEQTNSQSEENLRIGIKQTLHANYFDVIVNKVSIQDDIDSANLKREQGIKYLIINATFKNTDKESRMMTDGSVWINYNGKELEYDNSETTLINGWGIFLDQINPLISKTTNLVYKIPKELKGDMFWQPGRADNTQRIFLGKLE